MSIPDENLRTADSGDDANAGNQSAVSQNADGSNTDENTFEDASNDERLADATAASEPSFTLEPEKGIQADDPNKNNDGADKDDYNVKQ